MPAHFDDWLLETKSILAEIRSSVAEVRIGASTLFTRGTGLRDEGVQLHQKGRALGARDGPWWSVTLPLREGVRQSMALTHSLELAVKPAYLLAGMGVDLARVVPRQEFGTPPNIGTIAQHAPARLLGANENECHAIALDQFGIEVPMQFAFLGTSPRFSLEITLHPRPDSGLSEFAVRQTRSLSLCPTESLSTSMRIWLVREATRHVEASLIGSFVPPFDFEMGFGRPQYYGSGFDENLRIFGAWGRRSRGRVPFLGALPDWAHIGAKFSTSVLVDKLNALASRVGARLVSGPNFFPGQRFEVVGQVERSFTKRIGCVRFRADVTVKVRLNCSVRVSNGNVLVFRAEPLGSPDVKVETHPRRLVPPVLQSLIDGYLGEVAESFIPNFNIPPEHYPLGMVRQAEVDLDSQRLVIYMEMRR